jgi:hypothetical protein
MGPKYKVTGCARFFVFLIIFVPAVFFGAAYFRGENGMQIIKDFIHKTIGGSSSTSSSDNETYSIESLEARLKKAEKEIQTLKQTIKDQEAEIARLKSEGQ